MLAAMVYWKDAGANDLAIDTSDDAIEKVTLKVNGALHGEFERKKYTNRTYKILTK